MSTIVAVSTPRGRGALSVVRLSGSRSLEIAENLAGEAAVFCRRPKLAQIKYSQSSAILDEVLITYFEAPHSATGEDVIEISCHGSPAVVRQLIDMALGLGARLAEPGEFTLRALAHGKINLSQAEAIRDLISAQTEAAAKQAAQQLRGSLSKALEPLKDQLIETIVVLESAVEFVEDDLPAVRIKAIEERIGEVARDVEKLAQTFDSGHLLQDGIRVAITGHPNVGKSSLFNKLVERERAIVTSIPGTTRDTLSETIDIGGIPVVLTDTAGLRETSDDIETLGIERTHQAAEESDLVLTVIDATDGEAKVRTLAGESASVHRLVVVNKCDLVAQSESSTNGSAIRVSAKTGEGLDALRTAILEHFNKAPIDSDGLLVTNARHHDLLRRAKAECDAAGKAIRDKRSEELILAPLHNALRYLGEITGETTTEDILSSIFATFCIGK